MDFEPIYANTDEMELRTKTILLSYQCEILDYMSILDLSSNQFKGEISWQMGNLAALHSLNLSHNLLNGFIPKSLCKLKELENLDLSFNNLSGKTPIRRSSVNKGSRNTTRGSPADSDEEEKDENGIDATVPLLHPMSLCF
ncbi:hypothetical protein L6164_004514 [Bauhinia variegata]|uniref:Uncharacterized protein n=1 Tax=Bauhinia variegata TaxID=167791 RepID=A0ACB9Q6Q4_BAUVA|nr:hypothetical protein L6164_004514 [Bauhinia variegata]